MEVAKRFQSLDIGESHLSRLGGDEFTLTLPFASREREDTERRALDVADKIKSLFNEMFEIEGLNLYITCSIGIVVVEPDTDNID